MKTKDFLKKHSACKDGAKWALSVSEDMADVWEALIEQGEHDWLRWTATRPGVFPDTVLRKLACRFVRETPLSDGRKVWDLLTDERSRRAIEVAERYADGKATETELAAAAAAAYDAAYDADDDADDAADVAAADAADYAAADEAARAFAAAAPSAARAAAYDADAAAAYTAARDAYYTASSAAYAAYAAADAAFAAARAAARAAAYAAASAAAYDAARAAVYNAIYDAARAATAARVAQMQIIAEMGNPFKER